MCDAYDAMTTMRPFRREIRPDKALAVLMQGRGKAYDPGVTKALVAMLGIYPMGAVVMLDDGSTAVVYRVNNDDLLHPRVKVLADASGRWLETPEVLDLRLVDIETGSRHCGRSSSASRRPRPASTTSGSTSRPRALARAAGRTRLPSAPERGCRGRVARLSSASTRAQPSAASSGVDGLGRAPLAAGCRGRGLASRTNFR